MDQNRQAKATHVRTPKITDPIRDGQREPRADTPELGTWLDAVVAAARLLGLGALSGGRTVSAGAEPQVSRSGAVIVRADGVVLKIHAAGCDAAALASRLRTAVDAAPLLAPLRAEPVRVATPLGQRWVSGWPAVQPLQAESAREVAWPELGALAAALHRVPPARGLPPHGGLRRIRRVCDGLTRLSSPAWLIRLSTRIVEEAHRSPAGGCLVHGDLHLGQVGRAAAGWVLFDVDDLGWGDPAWDLGKIAGLWAAGQLDDRSWEDFLTGYRTAGGPAVPARGDPWPRLDLPARAAVLTTLYGLLRDRSTGVQVPDNLVQELLTTCARMSD